MSTIQCRKCSDPIEVGERRRPIGSGAIHERCAILIGTDEHFACADCGYMSDSMRVVRSCPRCGSDRTSGEQAPVDAGSLVRCEDCTTTDANPLVPRERTKLDGDPMLCLKCYSFRMAN